MSAEELNSDDLYEERKDEIEFLIYCCSEFIVFIDKSYDLDWQTSDSYDKALDEKGDESKNSRILNEVAALEVLVGRKWPNDIKLECKRFLGEALARAFTFEYEAADDMLERAKSLIPKKSSEVSRLWILQSCGVSCVIGLVVGLLVYLLKDLVSEYLGQTTPYLALSFNAGCLGAFLSVSFRMGKKKFDDSVGKELHHLEGFVRIVSGGLSAVLVAVLMKIGLIFSSFTQNGNLYWGMIAAGFIAGASERLTPDLIGTFEKEAKGE